ncbi:unnamed protein product [Adineta ricciae]|nr:unnamed protein product [Adineta ricciae]
MFQQFLPPTVIHDPNGLILYADLDYKRLSQCTEGYSGADIKLVCKEAAMNPVRKIFDILEHYYEDVEGAHSIELDSITTADVEKVLSTTKPSGRMYQDKYIQWQKEFESV